MVLACVGAYFIYDIGRDNGTKAYYKHNDAVESRKEKIPNNNPVDVEKTDIASVSDKSLEKPQQRQRLIQTKKQLTKTVLQRILMIYIIRTHVYSLVHIILLDLTRWSQYVQVKHSKV